MKAQPVGQVRQKVAFVEQTGTRSDLRVCLNIIITGNPGASVQRI